MLSAKIVLNKFFHFFYFQTKLSSAGLIYAHYGKQVIAQIIGIDTEDNPDLLRAYEHLYKSFVESVDAIDNGINQFEGTPKYFNYYFLKL